MHRHGAPTRYERNCRTHSSLITSHSPLPLLIREYTPADLDALRRMHAQQAFDYAFPDLADPIFVSKLVLEDARGRVAMASLARLTCEIYLLMDRADDRARAAAAPDAREENDGEGNSHTRNRAEPRERFARLLTLHRAAEQDLVSRGLDDAHAWLPPPIAKRFGRRLESLGWVRDAAWTPYCFKLRT